MTAPPVEPAIPVIAPRNVALSGALLAGILPLLIFLAGCRDPALGALEGRLQAETVELQAIQGNLAGFAEEDALLRAQTADLEARLEAVSTPERLRAALSAAGLPEGRTEALGEPRVVMRLAPGGEAATALALGLGEAGLPAALGALRCDGQGCSATLTTAPPVRVRGHPPLTTADLPPRPWWPPDASRWERAKSSLAGLVASRAALGALADLKVRAARLHAMEQAAATARVRTDLVLGAVLDAQAADAATQEATAFEHVDGHAVRLVAVGARPSLVEALGRRGKVTMDGTAWVVTVTDPTQAALRKLRQRVAGP